MRDHIWHSQEILGGMFGISQSTKESKRERQREFNEMIFEYGSTWKKGQDQVSTIAPITFFLIVPKTRHF